MIARVLGAVTALLLAVVPATSAPQDWTRVGTRTAAGGIRVGNPRAPTSFVEIANYSCGHCAHFAEAGGATLTRAIRAGRLAVEYRPIVVEPAGLAATIVARCAAPDRFLAVNDALYAAQGSWWHQSAAFLQSQGAGWDGTKPAALRQLAERGGIARVAIAAGLPAPRIAACFADRRQLDDTLRAASAAAKLTRSTPTFVVGDRTYEGLDWPALAGQLGLNQTP